MNDNWTHICVFVSLCMSIMICLFARAIEIVNNDNKLWNMLIIWLALNNAYKSQAFQSHDKLILTQYELIDMTWGLHGPKIMEDLDLLLQWSAFAISYEMNRIYNNTLSSLILQ